MDLEFEWDPAKALANRAKHRVDFDEALTVFGDPLAVIFADPDHSAEENREIIVGCSASERLLIVSFVEMPNRAVRIISARIATRTEKRDYEESDQGETIH